MGEHSRLIGHSARELSLFDATGLNLLAVSRHDKRFTERLSEIRYQNGDAIVLQGNLDKLPDPLRDWDCLPLVERNLKLGSVHNGLGPVIILALAMGSTALGLAPVAFAFFAVAVLMVLTRTVPLREVYSHLDAPILIMLAALIPVGEPLRTTGATELIAVWLSRTASVLPAYGALAMIMVAAMAVTLFLNNVATVLVMAPIAATVATGLGYQPEAFLMAVAIGAGSDFLTPSDTSATRWSRPPAAIASATIGASPALVGSGGAHRRADADAHLANVTRCCGASAVAVDAPMLTIFGHICPERWLNIRK